LFYEAPPSLTKDEKQASLWQWKHKEQNPTIYFVEQQLVPIVSSHVNQGGTCSPRKKQQAMTKTLFYYKFLKQWLQYIDNQLQRPKIPHNYDKASCSTSFSGSM
jgi:hypothetical protein